MPKKVSVNKTFTFSYAPRNERYEMGKQMRKKCPRSSHAKWEAPADRHDPVDLIIESNKGRIPKLVPLRHGRMGRTPFTFYRGADFSTFSVGWQTSFSGNTKKMFLNPIKNKPVATFVRSGTKTERALSLLFPQDSLSHFLTGRGNF